MPRFIHPQHSRGLRSPGFHSPLTELSDRKIRNYILAGKYGEDKKQALIKQLEEKKKKNPKTKIKTTVKLSDFRHVL